MCYVKQRKSVKKKYRASLHIAKIHFILFLAGEDMRYQPLYAPQGKFPGVRKMHCLVYLLKTIQMYIEIFG